MAFKLNFNNTFEIDTAGGLDPSVTTTATFKALSAGIQTITPASGDTTDNTPYYDGGGFSTTEVTGKNFSIAFSGHRIDGDLAQDFIAGLEFVVGDGLKTLLRWTRSDGTIIIGQVTINNIVVAGGSANAKQTFSFTASFNGLPVVTPSV
jgi:hypothetical protein